MKKLRVAFVVQRCGLEVNGGAEALCLSVARHMVKHWEVDVLTTCALDYMTWQDHYPAGAETIDGVTVRRFPVSHRRDVAKFDRLSESISSRPRSSTRLEQERWMTAQGPVSASLMAYIDENAERYDLFVFYTYLYATTYFGLPRVREKALLTPLAHDEWTIGLSMWDDFFLLPRAIVFSAIEEREFLRRRFPNAPLDGDIVGVAIDAPVDVDPLRFRAKFGIEAPFMVYVGRLDEGKNSPLLFEYFLRLKRGGRSDLHLVLVGRSQVPVPQHPHIHELGFVSEADKWDAIGASQFLINPSSIESLSIVLLEAWHLRKPVIVNADAEVMVGQCRRSGGGLWFANYDEFEAEVALMGTPIAGDLGAGGHAYVEEHYRWERIERQYLALAGLAGAGPQP